MFKQVEEAYSRIKGAVNHTPVMTSRMLNKMLDCEVFFKCENYQRIGAFKFRGAYNALSQLSEDDKKKGVITHSSGNHAQAVSLASTLLGIKATIVMPENAPPVKVKATKWYGADVVMCGPNPEDREAAVEPLMEKHGYVLIHPFNDERVVAGAGTAAYELIKETGPLDVVFAPVGGGGLLSGTSIATKGLCPDAKVIAVEPKNADDAFRSVRDGKIYPSIKPNTIADGLRTSLGTITFEFIKKYVDEIVLVTEMQILDSMQFLWERMKMVVEPSGAVSLAGLMHADLSIDIKEKRVGVIISGGNIDLTDFFNQLRNKVEE